MPGREDLEVAAVQLGPQHGALTRVGPALAGLVDDVEADIADFPIEPSVRTDGDAGDAVAAERHVRVVAVADGRLAIDDAVAVRVVEAVDAGRHAEEQVAAVRQDAAADVPGRVVVEAFLHHARGVGHAVAVGVLKPDDPLLELREIADVARAVLVEVGNPGVARALGRREILLVELQQRLGGLQRMDHRQPVRMPANVERQVGAARADHVGRAVRVDVDGNRVGDEALGCPQAQLDSRQASRR